ncbi:MAG: FAD-binding oxidoreductase, partial [Cohaesibacter sp.]|nr:FAD-binding oxidoreductase [Cohaesibacter sp.]
MSLSSLPSSFDTHLGWFETLLGPDHCLTADSDTKRYCREPREKFPGRCWLVVRPGNRDEVAQIMAYAVQHDLAIVPQGGNTGLVGGQIPDESGLQIVISCERLNKIRSLDPVG